MLRVLLLVLFLFSFSYAKVITFEGEGGSSDIKKAEEEAVKNAKIRAVERYIGTLINSKTLIANGKLMRDIIQTKTYGKVMTRNVKIVDKYFSGKQEVCVKVAAILELPDKKEIKPADFGLVLLLNKKKLRAGERLRITVSSEKPCYPYLFSVDSKGRVFRLLPNRIQDTFKLQGKLTFPTESMIEKHYDLLVYPLPELKFPQKEEILFICTKEKVKALREFFPSFIVGETKVEKIKELLNRPFGETLETFNQVLFQVGIENYDMVDETYEILE